ncbi:hypothetical protein H7X87_01095 [Acetobacteraceae bacterium]|nr:hypothetical protein [Candidatus Parcubacteria bacterium]
MPQEDKNNPQDPAKNSKPQDAGILPTQPTGQTGGNTGIDLDKILLPKKEVHDPANAQRINAGALLESEQNATLRPVEQEGSISRQPAVQPPKEESFVRPIETYQGDIEKVVGQKNISVVSIAAAEAARRSKKPVEAPASPRGESSIKKWLLRTGMVLVGILFFTLAAGIFYFVYLKTRPLDPLQNASQAPFIIVDETKSIAIRPADLSKGAVMNILQAERDSLSLSLGLIERIYLAQASTGTNGEATYSPIDSGQFLSILSLLLPQSLARTIMPEPYLLGIHSFDGNQPFLVLRVDSYQQAYSGMLKWESTMQYDLAPFFTRTPRARIPEENIATSTASTTPVRVVPTKFSDSVVENHDARAILNENGDVLLLWTFLDRSTIVITTNEYTLREVISRFESAPVSI